VVERARNPCGLLPSGFLGYCGPVIGLPFGDRFREAQIGKTLGNLALERGGRNWSMFSCLVWPCVGIVEV